MGSNYHPNQAAANSLLGHPKIYDDSRLRKRTSMLASGLLLCFIIAIAALVISVMILFKEEDPTVGSPQQSKMAPQDQKPDVSKLEGIVKNYEKLEKEVQMLRQKLASIEESKESAVTEEKQTISLVSPVKEQGIASELDSKSNQMNKTDTFPESPPKEPLDPTETESHLDHSDDSELLRNMVDEIDVETVENRTVPQTAENQPSMTSHGHHHHETIESDSNETKELSGAPEPEVTFESPEIESVREEPKDGGLNIGILSLGEEGSSDFDYEESGSGFAFDDSYDYLPSFDEFELNFEGSGNLVGVACIDFARPICPAGVSICYTNDPCPRPVCCF